MPVLIVRIRGKQYDGQEEGKYIALCLHILHFQQFLTLLHILGKAPFALYAHFGCSAASFI